jgi:two-component system, OmpR family, response regulator
MRVLIVEDDLRMASLVRRGLTGEGLAADVAGTGEDALWMAQAHPYDAIVLDVMLPAWTGSRPAAACAGQASGCRS